MKEKETKLLPDSSTGLGHLHGHSQFEQVVVRGEKRILLMVLPRNLLPNSPAHTSHSGEGSID